MKGGRALNVGTRNPCRWRGGICNRREETGRRVKATDGNADVRADGGWRRVRLRLRTDDVPASSVPSSLQSGVSEALKLAICRARLGKPGNRTRTPLSRRQHLESQRHEYEGCPRGFSCERLPGSAPYRNAAAPGARPGCRDRDRSGNRSGRGPDLTGSVAGGVPSVAGSPPGRPGRVGQLSPPRRCDAAGSLPALPEWPQGRDLARRADRRRDDAR